MNVTMPMLPGAKTYTLAKVLVSIGEAVEAGQELFNVETDKRAVVIRAKESGIVARLLAEEGREYAPGDDLAEIESAQAREATGASPASSKAASQSARDAEGEGKADLLVIGGGTGGYVAALYAAKLGKRVTLIERDQLGGTCLNRGCIPTKSLVASASMHRNIKQADQWGIEVTGSVQPRMDKIIDRKDEIVSTLRGGLEFLMEKNAIDVIRGSARFTDERTVHVSSREGEIDLEFNDCIIATGSVIRPIDIPGSDLPKIMNTDEALDCRNLPSSIAVIGGGVTGMEFAFLYSNLGVRVSVVARRPRLLHTFGNHASETMMASALDHGIHVELNADVRGFAEDGDQVVTTFEQNGQTKSIRSEVVLMAGGRKPLTEGLGLGNAGVAVDKATGAVKVDGHMRTSVDHLYAIGDVNGLVMLAHAASYQGRVAVDNIMGTPAVFDEALVPCVAYTDPEVAMVGIGADEAKGARTDLSIGTFSFAHNGKALADNESAGDIALVADADGAIKGAEVIGSHASALIGYAGLSIAAGLTANDIQRSVFAHPTTTEVIGEAAYDLTFGALHE